MAKRDSDAAVVFTILYLLSPQPKNRYKVKNNVN